MAASLASRGLEPDVVDIEQLATALAQPDVAAIYAGRYASHEALDALEATKPLYRYEKSAGAFKLDRRCDSSNAPKWVSLEVESEERVGRRLGLGGDSLVCRPVHIFYRRPSAGPAKKESNPRIHQPRTENKKIQGGSTAHATICASLVPILALVLLQ